MVINMEKKELEELKIKFSEKHPDARWDILYNYTPSVL